MNQYYALRTNAVTELERQNQEKVRELASECIVILENDGVLPLSPENRKIALFGNGAKDTVKGGTGSGDVNSREVICIEDGLKAAGFEITTHDRLEKYSKKLVESKASYMEEIEAMAREKNVPTLMAMFAKPYESPQMEPISEEEVKRSETDTAVYVLARNSGEGKDRDYKPGDYLLREDEERNIRFLADHYERFIVLLNVGGIIDTEVLKSISGINAIVLIGQTGNAGGHIVADFLAGKSIPSGKLTDTWAVRYEDYSNSKSFSHNNGNTDDEYYTEGIYVGYRYFDTFGVEPSYCFGYGKGYTEFALRTENAAIENQALHLEVKVSNIGEKYSGKEVVQAYYSAPEGSLEKPYQELAGFAKTKLLSPGESEVVRIVFPIAQMASYDMNDAAWKLEKGEYLVRVGNSSRNSEIAAVLSLSETVVTEQLKNICKDVNDVEELGAPKEKRTLSEKELSEYKTAVHIEVDVNSIRTVHCQYQSERPVYEDHRKGEQLTLTDVKEGKAALEELVAQLTVEELADLCVGTFRSGGSGESVVGSASAAVPGAAADTTSKLIAVRKIPNLILADGPAGLRLQTHFKTTADGELLPGGEMFGMDIKPFPEDTPKDAVDYYQYCTAIPVATSLAQSWNMELIEEIGKLVGKEMQQYHVHLWLAPGMNIHRNPLCGRNFEYYSEDPVLSGKCAAADTRGVQSFAGQGTTIKHLAVNNQEDNRMFSNSHVTERTLREIYLKGFGIAVKEAQPYSIMTSYNLLNGIHTANHYELLQTVARDEWGFEGVVMTDWFSSQDTSKLGETSDIYPWSSSVQCIYAGNDLQMPGCVSNITDIIEAVNEKKEITLGDLQFCAMNILKVMLKIV